MTQAPQPTVAGPASLRAYAYVHGKQHCVATSCSNPELFEKKSRKFSQLHAQVVKTTTLSFQRSGL
jgi:hypothetical protein